MKVWGSLSTPTGDEEEVRQHEHVPIGGKHIPQLDVDESGMETPTGKPIPGGCILENKSFCSSLQLGHYFVKPEWSGTYLIRSTELLFCCCFCCC